MKVKWIVILLALAGLAAAAVGLVRAKTDASERTEAGSRVAQATPQKRKPKVQTEKPKPEPVVAEPAKESPLDAERAARAKESEARRRAHHAAIETQRREYEAFMKMSPEEQRRFRARKRKEYEEKRASERANQEKGMHALQRHGEQGAAAPENATAENAATQREDDGSSALAKQKELRAAALKARAEYEESMGEVTAARYRRRSLGYWMHHVRQERERAAAHERQEPSENDGANAGAGVTGNQKRQVKSKGKQK